MAHPRVSATRFTKIHYFKQNILNVAVFSRMLGITDQSQPRVERFKVLGLRVAA
jgi:hypothetical protein